MCIFDSPMTSSPPGFIVNRVHFSFLRRHHQGQVSSGSGDNKSSDKSSSASAGGSLSAGIFRNFGSMGSAAKAPAVVVLSEEEKALRRERLSAAAQDRSKSWDKKLGQKKPSQSLNVPIVDGNAVEAEAAGSSNGTHADTERAIRKTKELEVRIEQVGTRLRSRHFFPFFTQ